MKHPSSPRLAFITAFLLLTGFCDTTFAAGPKPNFLLIIADDCTCRDLELHGDQAKTPHLPDASPHRV